MIIQKRPNEGYVSRTINCMNMAESIIEDIGNRAITVGDGREAIQLQYGPVYTIGSTILPVAVIGISFYSFDRSQEANWWRTVQRGVFMGAAICGMHYLGQAGIANYDCVNLIGHVVGATLIAVAASAGALSLFFYWTSI